MELSKITRVKVKARSEWSGSVDHNGEGAGCPSTGRQKRFVSFELMLIGCRGLLGRGSWTGAGVMVHDFHLSSYAQASGAHKLRAFRIVHAVSKRVPGVRSPAWDSTGLAVRGQTVFLLPLPNPPQQPPTTVLGFDPCSGSSSIPESLNISLSSTPTWNHVRLFCLHPFSRSQNTESHRSYVPSRHSVAPALPWPAS